MKEFLLLFRNTQSSDAMPSPEQLQNISKAWQDWFSSIEAKNKLSSRGNRLDFEGTTVRPNNVVTDGPYAEIKEIMLGYIVVKTNLLEDATELAKGCPILLMGGNVEVRGIVEINM
ncbi:MAG TPA: YciI family protein [Mucilaginibacter sp.]|jgi:hypothetical protein